MGTTALVPVGEYLSTDYSPDCDYIDGVLEDRNVGEHDHGRLQAMLISLLMALEKKLGIRVVAEQRVQISLTRFRVPDVCVVIGKPDEQVFTRPPFLCAEILSPEDRMSRMDRKVRDYLGFGVPYVWVIDPTNRTATTYTPHQGTLVTGDGVLQTVDPEIIISLPDLFAAL